VAATIGPLLEAALAEPHARRSARQLLTESVEAVFDRVGAEYPLAVKAPQLPVLFHLPYEPPREGETWSDYRTRTAASIEPLLANAEARGLETQPLLAANAVLVHGTRDEIKSLLDEKLVEHAELNATMRLTALNDVPADIELASGPLSTRLDAGRDVTVAVLDSGVDVAHPALQVADSISVCNEDVDVPGIHGTYCAGIIASRDPVFTGIAPGVTLVNVKTVRSNSLGEPEAFARGVDAALDRHADIISASLGANHLPTWSEGGEGWTCPAPAGCVMCRAVRSAVDVEHPPAFVVAAAGNAHVQAQHLRDRNLDGSFDSELSCPGQAGAALTVGAIAKATFVPAATSSHGPTSYGTPKPDVCADGVNVTSTVPAPRDAAGAPQTDDRSRLFARDSGTSAATAVVGRRAGLIIGERRTRGTTPTPHAIRAQLLARLATLPYPPLVVGAGRTRV
jgi:serine protease AprX